MVLFNFVTLYQKFENNQIVQVLNPMGNVLTIGKVKFASRNLPDKGEVLTTISYLNDEIWSLANKKKSTER